MRIATRTDRRKHIKLRLTAEWPSAHVVACTQDAFGGLDEYLTTLPSIHCPLVARVAGWLHASAARNYAEIGS